MAENESRANQEAPVPVPASLENSAGFLLNRAARIIRERVTEALEPLGMSPQEMGLLKIIDAEGPNTQQALCTRHNVDRTTMVQLIDHLEERQLVMRQPSASDRRANLIYLTPRGRKTLSKTNRLAKKEQEKFLEPLSEPEWESLRQHLVKLLEFHMQKHSD